MVHLKFVRAHGAYQEGEIAAFDSEIAEALISRGVAATVDDTESGHAEPIDPPNPAETHDQVSYADDPEAVAGVGEQGDAEEPEPAPGGPLPGTNSAFVPASQPEPANDESGAEKDGEAGKSSRKKGR